MNIETNKEPNKHIKSLASMSGCAPKRALVFNDEPEMCELIAKTLGSAEIESVILGTGFEADDQYHDVKFDVIFVALCGPPADGVELVRQIRGAGFNQMTPIILISEDQCPRALPRGFEAGATFFVYRPLDKIHLMRLINVPQGTIEREKRRFRRVLVQVKVLLKFDKVELVGETIDLSLNGALVRAGHALPIGSVVEVSLYLLEEMDPVVGWGAIVRVLDVNQMGILLDQISAKESGRLQEYLLPRIVS